MILSQRDRGRGREERVSTRHALVTRGRCSGRRGGGGWDGWLLRQVLLLPPIGCSPRGCPLPRIFGHIADPEATGRVTVGQKEGQGRGVAQERGSERQGKARGARGATAGKGREAQAEAQAHTHTHTPPSSLRRFPSSSVRFPTLLATLRSFPSKAPTSLARQSTSLPLTTVLRPLPLHDESPGETLTSRRPAPRILTPGEGLERRRTEERRRTHHQRAT